MAVETSVISHHPVIEWIMRIVQKPSIVDHNDFADAVLFLDNICRLPLPVEFAVLEELQNNIRTIMPDIYGAFVQNIPKRVASRMEVSKHCHLVDGMPCDVFFRVQENSNENSSRNAIIEFLLNLSHFRRITSNPCTDNDVIGQDEFVRSIQYLQRVTIGKLPFPLSNKDEVDSFILSLVKECDKVIKVFGTSQLKKKRKGTLLLTAPQSISSSSI